MQKKLTILLTGGTMDGIVNPGDEVKTKGESAANKYLDSLKLHRTDYEFKRVFEKDSRAVTDEDREILLKAIIESKTDKILITHGTFTMAETGSFLKKHSDQLKGKTIVLTGSMIPLQKWEPGDAPFNLGFAIASVFHLEPGVYVSMNGYNFDPEKTKKNVEELVFESLGE